MVKLIQDIIVVLVTCKNEEDPINKEIILRFPIVSLWEMMTPGATQGAGFILGTTNHCNTQNIKALDLMVAEKKIFFTFSYCKSAGEDDPRGVANLDPRCMIGRIYVGYH